MEKATELKFRTTFNAFFDSDALFNSWAIRKRGLDVEEAGTVLGERLEVPETGFSRSDGPATDRGF